MTSPDVEAIAHVAHEANRAWQLETKDPAPSPRWEDAPAWQRNSAREGVRNALAGHSPAELHVGWMADKTERGWVYGPVKDDQAKTHPCLVAYADLPPEQRAKDALFLAVVKALGVTP